MGGSGCSSSSLTSELGVGWDGRSPPWQIAGGRVRGVERGGRDVVFSSLSDPVLGLKPDTRLLRCSGGRGTQGLLHGEVVSGLDFRRKCRTWRKAFLVIALSIQPCEPNPWWGISVVIGAHVWEVLIHLYLRALQPRG